MITDKQRLIVVGERSNSESQERSDLSWHDLYTAGAFISGRSLSVLKDIGLTEFSSLNLLSPAPTSLATWNAHDKVAAKEKAWETLLHAKLLGSRIVCCGSRVSEAFGVTYEPLSVQTREKVLLYIIPHPSPRNRWWNDNKHLAKDFVKAHILST